jgi:hypothetical protein
MPDEWTKVISGEGLVKFTYQELREDGAFLTAQIAGHEVVYSVILTRVDTPLSREAVEQHFEHELSKKRG